MDSLTALLYVNIALWASIGACLGYLAHKQVELKKKMALLESKEEENAKR